VCRCKPDCGISCSRAVHFPAEGDLGPGNSQLVVYWGIPRDAASSSGLWSIIAAPKEPITRQVVFRIQAIERQLRGQGRRIRDYDKCMKVISGLSA
jgi:hypothetical protein